MEADLSQAHVGRYLNGNNFDVSIMWNQFQNPQATH